MLGKITLSIWLVDIGIDIDVGINMGIGVEIDIWL